MKNPVRILTEQLLSQTNGIVLIDGYSGCGKTTLLNKLKKITSRPVHLFSYENVVDEILRAAKAKENCERYLLELCEKNCIIGIEDIDYLRGKEATQECLSLMIQKAAEKHLVILTGNDVRRQTPVFAAICGHDTFVYTDLDK